MKNKVQKHIVEQTGIHQSTVSNIINGRRRPSWKNAKRLAQATNTSPDLWMEGTPEDLRQALVSDSSQNR